MLEVKSPEVDLENASEGLVGGLDTAEQRISELRESSTESSKTEKQRAKRLN